MCQGISNLSSFETIVNSDMPMAIRMNSAAQTIVPSSWPVEMSSW